MDAARALAPSIREHADEIEATRQLPRALFNALADAGLFHLAVPRVAGGLEIDFPSFVRVIEEIGKADASTGWCVNQGAIFGSYAARMPAAVARTIWTETPRSVVANTPAPTARAVVVAGGYRVSGRQGFSTGCRHATWLAAHAQVIEGGKVRMHEGKPETRYLMVPATQAEIVDTWHTRGMRGTGTHHFSVDEVFVPAERSVLLNAPVLHDAPLYRVPRTLLFAAGDAAVALGTARRCLDVFAELAGAKTPRYEQGLLREQAMVQFSVGRAEATLRAARAFLMEAVAETWNEANAGAAASLEARAGLRLATTHGIRLAAEVIDSLYAAAGATAAFEGNLIQRYFQDIHVITQHVQARLSHYELAGRHVLGLPIDEIHL
ncbi:MAG: acyl-CoA dehydrogenase family protein [Burkholderiales bacterium]|nr:acyl-CoA dehydrogenase family protein [Burkholderiales bacterium]